MAIFWGAWRQHVNNPVRQVQRDSFDIGATLLYLTAWSLGNRGSLGDACRSQYVPYQLSMLAHAYIPRGWGQPWLYKKFQASLSYRVRHYLNIPPLHLKIEDLNILHLLRSACPLADTVIEMITMAHSVPPSAVPSLLMPLPVTSRGGAWFSVPWIWAGCELLW